ncbi:hypothetical protein [Lewinella cohaerens]|uniref:hypothetical protein n=1 Tax=Lewinella cohaerens TaxID=70995 RepID=UPI000379BBBF|nr:hypothetical protein [Lewinella cohaerens]
MENRELDQLFKAGLETMADFHTPEEQWEVVAARLAAPNRRKPIWWWLLGTGIGVVVLCLALAPKSGGSMPVVGAFQIPIATEIETSSHQIAPLRIPFEKEAAKGRDGGEEKLAPVTIYEEKESQSLPTSIPIFGKEGTAETIVEKVAEKQLGGNYTYHYPAAFPTIKEPISTGAVRNIATLPFIDLTSKDASVKEKPLAISYEKPMTSKAKVDKWALEMGVQQDFISASRVGSPDLSLQYYGAVAVNFSPNWQARMAYGQGEVQRTISGDPNTYNVPVVDVPLDEDFPSITKLQYHNQNLDVQLAYHLHKLKKLTISINTGLQWNKDTGMNAVYDYDGVYQPVTVEAQLPDTKFLLSDLTAGVRLGYSLTSAYHFHAGFQQYFSLDRSGTFRWPLRRRVQLGMSYQF